MLPVNRQQVRLRKGACMYVCGGGEGRGGGGGGIDCTGIKPEKPVPIAILY